MGNKLPSHVAIKLSNILADLDQLAERYGKVVYGQWAVEDGVKFRQITVEVGEFTATFWEATAA